jgi:TIR domain
VKNKPTIFLSHSANDKPFALELSQQIERALHMPKAVFVSSRPDAIPSGSIWFATVFDNLEAADVLVVLITKQSEKSVWVGFEVGYFWKKANGFRIYVLRHPQAVIPSPLNTLQAKLITDANQLRNFFDELCHHYGQTLSDRIDITRLVEQANVIIDIPPKEGVDRFMYLLDTTLWLRKDIDNTHVWTCVDDIAYQIAEAEDNDTINHDFSEEWTQHFFDKRAFRYSINLTINGRTIEQLTFISLDGGRYLVPMPKIRQIDDTHRTFFWSRNSLEFKVGKLVGYFSSVYPDIEAVSAYTGVEIV